MILSLFQRKFLWKGREERNFVSKIWITFFSYPRVEEEKISISNCVRRSIWPWTAQRSRVVKLSFASKKTTQIEQNWFYRVWKYEVLISFEIFPYHFVLSNSNYALHYDKSIDKRSKQTIALNLTINSRHRDKKRDIFVLRKDLLRNRIT